MADNNNNDDDNEKTLKTERTNSKLAIEFQENDWSRPFTLIGERGNYRNFYGKRRWVRVESPSRFAASVHQYSLLTGVFATAVNAAHTQPATQAVRRYIGQFDIDMELEPIKSGAQPLFADGGGDSSSSRKTSGSAAAAASQSSEDIAHENTEALKMRISRRLRRERTLEGMCRACPEFRRAYEAAAQLGAALHRAHVPHVVFFSGGKGFRVLVADTQLWIEVPARAALGEAGRLWIVREILCSFYFRKRLQMSPAEIAAVEPYIDPNIYDNQKGVKPDTDAHPVTRLYPTLVPEAVYGRETPPPAGQQTDSGGGSSSSSTNDERGPLPTTRPDGSPVYLVCERNAQPDLLASIHRHWQWVCQTAGEDVAEDRVFSLQAAQVAFETYGRAAMRRSAKGQQQQRRRPAPQPDGNEVGPAGGKRRRVQQHTGMYVYDVVPGRNFADDRIVQTLLEYVRLRSPHAYVAHVKQPTGPAGCEIVVFANEYWCDCTRRVHSAPGKGCWYVNRRRESYTLHCQSADCKRRPRPHFYTGQLRDKIREHQWAQQRAAATAEAQKSKE